MADYVWLEEIERLEAERNDGKTLDGYDILDTKKLTLLESLTLEDELRTPSGQYEFIFPQRVDKLQKGDKAITRYYSVIHFMDVDPSGKKLKRGLDVLKAYAVC